MKIDNSSIERVEEFKYLGITLTNKNSIQEEIKSRLKLGNVCYYSVQNLLSSSLLSKKLCNILTHRGSLCVQPDFIRRNPVFCPQDVFTCSELKLISW